MSPINLDDLDDFESLEELNRALEKRVQKQNRRPLTDFDGLSPEQMGALQYNFPSGDGPLCLNKLSDTELQKSPLLQQVLFLIDKMKSGETINLTKTGALSTKLVKELYSLGYLKNEMIEKEISKLYRENEVMEIHITRIFLEISSLAKKRNGKLSLTKKGEKHAEDGNFILKEILHALFYEFNWAYFDGYASEKIGKINPAFSLFLLKKHGKDRKPGSFYAEKYFKALPMLKEENGYDFRCYVQRTFNRYFYFLGFVEKEQKDILAPFYLKKTAFFDQLFELEA